MAFARRAILSLSPDSGASMVDIAVIHLEGDVIQWYNWFEHTQGVSTLRFDVKVANGRNVKSFYEVFPDDDLRSTAHDRKKIKSLQWKNRSKRVIICRTQQNMNITPLTVKKDAPPWPSGTIALTTTMPSTPTPTFPDCGQMFLIGAETSRVGIVTLMQDDRPLIRTEAFPTLHTRLLICKGILIATEFKVWLNTGPRHEREARKN
ncbi:hypothetical protein GW17_00022706 [Ensete ventricosum]|nr:hypothetical protein GW17_00022706 [Ensete ventricosum]